VTVYQIAPPLRRRQVSKITEIDLSLFDGPVALKQEIGGININDPAHVTATAFNNRKTLEGTYKFIIEFDNGDRARANFAECQAVLNACGQVWPT
jgi:hypothetical protein